VPVLAAATVDNLYIYSILPHFDIDGITGGGPFAGELLNPNNNSVISQVMLYCDSTSQDFDPPQTFAVNVVKLDTAGNTSLDPWVIANSDPLAGLYDAIFHTTLSTEEIESSIQGVIWDLDGQIAAGTMTSGDAGTQGFANFLYSVTLSSGTHNVPGYYLYDAGIDYPNGPGGVNGQSQIGYPTPEPSAFLGLALPAVGLAFRRRAKKA
jgi:hypothetical protein